MKKTVSILGSTGSIGKQALEVIESSNEKFEILAIATANNIEELKIQIKKFSPKIISVKNQKDAEILSKQYKNIEILYGDEGLKKIASDKRNNIVLVAVSGSTGLFPTIEALKNKIPVALANKETIVTAGSIVMEIAKKYNTPIIPVDSEHSAIHQCIKNINEVRKLIVTASGGPFRTKSIEEIHNATVEETLNHPNWFMGYKITVDSATLMNKGLEVIEAHHLFDIDYKNIDVVIHPQSIIHSAVETIDGSVISQMGVPSMHIPIQYALSYPDRFEGIKTNSFNLAKVGSLEFYEPDVNKFPCLRLAYEAGEKANTYPTVLNAVNEECVYAFLDKKIKLTDIAKYTEEALSNHKEISNPTFEDIIKVDFESRELFKSKV